MNLLFSVYKIQPFSQNVSPILSAPSHAIDMLPYIPNQPQDGN